MKKRARWAWCPVTPSGNVIAVLVCCSRLDAWRALMNARGWANIPIALAQKFGYKVRRFRLEEDE